MTTAIARVVDDDLCIGCGLCEAATGGRVRMTLTDRGSLRPSPLDALSAGEAERLANACPGVVAAPRPDAGTGASAVDPVWGAFRSMGVAWAADPEVRFRSATGGVLTALAGHAIATGQVDAVLHVGADPDHPLRNRWVLSTTPDEVLANSGSRYAPTAPLAGLAPALDRGRPFAIVAKPCDLGAVHRWADVDRRVDELCVLRLALVCGGQSRLTKTTDLLGRLGITESEVASVRYRGLGNPGPTRVVTDDGRVAEVSYLEMWADEGSWEVETRCKLCPDALGEAADIAAADAWPGGAPTAEDDGFNAIVVRTAAGQAAVDAATADGWLRRGPDLEPRQLDDLQPHQVRKKVAMAARYQGLADAGATPIEAPGLRLDALGRRLDPDAARAERDGTARRMRAIRSGTGR